MKPQIIPLNRQPLKRHDANQVKNKWNNCKRKKKKHTKHWNVEIINLCGKRGLGASESHGDCCEFPSWFMSANYFNSDDVSTFLIQSLHCCPSSSLFYNFINHIQIPMIKNKNANKNWMRKKWHWNKAQRKIITKLWGCHGLKEIEKAYRDLALKQWVFFHCSELET